MAQFLLVYDRPRGTLVRVERFEESAGGAALDARFAEEAAHRGEDVEVVVITAPSLDAVKRSHARYFLNASEILAS